MFDWRRALRACRASLFRGATGGSKSGREVVLAVEEEFLAGVWLPSSVAAVDVR